MDAQARAEELAKQISCMAQGAATKREIIAVMDALEHIAATDAETACLLMTDLWPIASKAYLHDVCDAIGFWIDSHRSRAVIAKLAELSTSYPEPEVRSYWSGLLSTL